MFTTMIGAISIDLTQQRDTQNLREISGSNLVKYIMLIGYEVPKALYSENLFVMRETSSHLPNIAIA